MSRRRFDVLFIDFYGTVTSGDRQAVEDTCRLVVERLGLEMTAPKLALAWGRRFFEALDQANDGSFRNLFELEQDTLVETLAPVVGRFDPCPFVQHLKGYWACPGLQPDAREGLAALASLDIPMCCVSNADTEDVESAVRHHGLRFDHLVTSEDARCYKPHAGIFEKALAEMRVTPDRVMHVGDSLHSDIAGAQPLGITATWISREGRIFDIGEACPDHNIISLKELYALLR